MLASILVIAMSSLPAPAAGAQGTTATVRVNLPVTSAISVLDVTTSTADFGTIGSAQLSTGFVDVPGPTIRVRSNLPFVVSMAAATSTFGPAAKPASDVGWTTSGAPYTALSNSPAIVLAGVSGGDRSERLDFRMQLAAGTDAPGLYQLALTITLTAP
jgi:hypothetical protein